MDVNTWKRAGVSFRNAAYAQSRAWKWRAPPPAQSFWSPKNKLDGRMCTPVSELWPTCTHTLETWRKWGHRHWGGELRSECREWMWEAVQQCVSHQMFIVEPLCHLIAAVSLTDCSATDGMFITCCRNSGSDQTALKSDQHWSSTILVFM